MRQTWYAALTPLQRVVFAVVWTAYQQKRDEADWQRGVEEAIYGRP